jgi:hypothetical protein
MADDRAGRRGDLENGTCREVEMCAHIISQNFRKEGAALMKELCGGDNIKLDYKSTLTWIQQL